MAKHQVLGFVIMQEWPLTEPRLLDSTGMPLFLSLISIVFLTKYHILREKAKVTSSRMSIKTIVYVCV